jgi:hypothetical protein
MPLTLQTIITEADILAPNTISTADKVVYLNSINGDFFNVCKIPKIFSFTSTSGATVTLPADVRQKNIDLVQIGALQYDSLDMGNPSPQQIGFSFDDSSKVLTLRPAPYQSGLDCLCRYRRIATTTFVSGNLAAVPDAPEEYHWTYVPALASWLAKAEDDMGKAALYEQQYKDAWNVAAQGFAGGATR